MPSPLLCCEEGTGGDSVGAVWWVPPMVPRLMHRLFKETVSNTIYFFVSVVTRNILVQGWPEVDIHVAVFEWFNISKFQFITCFNNNHNYVLCYYVFILVHVIYHNTLWLWECDLISCIVSCGLSIAHCTMWIVDCRSHIAQCRLWIVDSGL